MRVSGNPCMVTQSEPNPSARPPPMAGAPRSIVFEILLVFGSMRCTCPSFSHNTQTEPSPKALAIGEGSFDVFVHLIRFWIDPQHAIFGRAGDPQRGLTESESVAAGGQTNFGNHRVEFGIDARKRRFIVGEGPD